MSRGFSLLEILVVLVIVGIIAAIALPMLERQSPTDIHAGPFSQLARHLEDLPVGNVVLKAPDKMRLGDTAGASLAVSPTLSLQALEARVNQRIPDGVLEGGEGIRLSQKMRASLTGRGFAVTQLTEGEQLIKPSGQTTWNWQITAEDADASELQAALYAVIEVDGTVGPLEVRTFSHRVDVEVTLAARVASFWVANWQWLAGTILIPLFLYWWARRRAGRKRIS